MEEGQHEEERQDMAERPHEGREGQHDGEQQREEGLQEGLADNPAFQDGDDDCNHGETVTMLSMSSCTSQKQYTERHIAEALLVETRVGFRAYALKAKRLNSKP